ncbi:hypothetical protein B0H13DRAFT_2047354, partial [Mycena leptocephala]
MHIQTICSQLRRNASSLPSFPFITTHVQNNHRLPSATACNYARLQSTGPRRLRIFTYDELPVRRYLRFNPPSKSARSADSAPPSVLLEPSPLHHAIAIHLIPSTEVLCSMRPSAWATLSSSVCSTVSNATSSRSLSSCPCTLRWQWVFAWMSCSSL